MDGKRHALTEKKSWYRNQPDWRRIYVTLLLLWLNSPPKINHKGERAFFGLQCSRAGEHHEREQHGHGSSMVAGTGWSHFFCTQAREDRMLGAQKSLQSQISTGETSNVKLAWSFLQRKRCTTCFPTRMPEMKVANSWGTLCAICMARVSSRLPQTGQEVVDSLNHLWAICMTENTPDPSISP